ncbi:MAG: SMC family ATPase [Deltaproteobacteria bacterium]|nr:SMC family ATPase [Deltaproteobacteria bacterium]
MRPQQLTLKNFMPFRAADGHGQTVDFSNLDLFAITGPMASGKSSLIDAIVWCLYGRTARYGADSKGVISAGESTCEVAFDFTIGARQFRAVRRTGKTTESGLSEYEAGEWIQDVSGSDRLTGRIEELLGLDFDSFTKTVILPQGRYAEFLSSKPADRRDLLANILELEVYARIAERAKETETRSKARADTIRESLAQPQYAGVTRAMVEQKRAEHKNLTQELAQVNAQVEVLSALTQQAEAASGMTARVAELRREEQTRVAEHARVQQRAEAAEEQGRSRTQTIVEVEQERETLGYDARRHEVVQRAVSYLQEYETASREAEEKTSRLAQARQELETLSRLLAEQAQEAEQARRRCEEQAQAVRAEIAASGDVTALTEQLTTARRWKELRQEQTRLTEQQAQNTRQLAMEQSTLATLLEQEKAKETELRELQQQRDRMRGDAQEKQQQELEANHLGKDLQEAAREEKRVTQEIEQAQTAVLAAERELQRQQELVLRAERQEQNALHAVEEDRRKNAIAHVRATLHGGEPCPVCLVPVGELPPAFHETQVDQKALQLALEQARVGLTQAQQTIRKAEAAVAAACAKKESGEQELTAREQRRREAQERFTLRFPGFPSLSVALAALRDQQQEMVALSTELDARTQTAEKDKQDLTRQREDAQRSEATLNETLRGAATTLEAGAAQMATMEAVLAPYRTANNDPETELVARRQQLLQMEQEGKTLEAARRQAEEALSALATRKIQTEGICGVLQSESNAASAQAERAARAVREHLDVAHDMPLPTFAALADELAALAKKQERHTVLTQRLESLQQEHREAERGNATLRVDVEVRSGFVLQTRQAIIQTEEELAQARTALRAAIGASALPDLAPDGENAKEQLAATYERGITLRERRSGLEAEANGLEGRCTEKEQEEQKLKEAESEGRLATDLRKLLGAEFTDYLSEGAITALMHDASVHLQKLTHGRYSFRIEYKRRTIDLLIVDHEDQQRTRPTHSLSGGETFLASLAIALALAQSFREIATGKAAKTSTECLILDEGFGTLDREGLQLVSETLQELRGEEGRVVGIITHVEEVAAAMPMRIEVRRGSRTSTIAVTG